MNKSRIDFKNYEIVDSGAKFYKGKDCEEGFYHVCDEYAPGGTRLLEFMPEIYRHDISVSFCQTINGHSAMHPIKFCPICGKQLEYQGGTTMFDCGIDDVAIGSGTLKGFVFLREDLLEE